MCVLEKMIYLLHTKLFIIFEGFVFKKGYEEHSM